MWISVSALETLAEVSRRHLELQGNNRAPGLGLPNPRFRDRANEHNHNMNAEYLLPMDDAAWNPDLTQEALNSNSLLASYYPNVHELSSPQSSASMGGHMASHLMDTASQALQSSVPSANSVEAEVQEQGQNKGFPWPSIVDPLLQENAREPAPMADQSLNKPTGYPRPVTMLSPGLGANTKARLAMKRGRFSDVRRREVSEVRKRGACIRCRMLKKPVSVTAWFLDLQAFGISPRYYEQVVDFKQCSGDTPCLTCANVEAARLWKTPCIRTRITEVFELYSAGL
jgi:hypothetical protein